MGLICRKLSILTYVFDWLFFTQCLTSSSSINHLLHLYAQFLILFHLTNEVLLTNPFANVFVFGDFNIHHKDWLTYVGGTDRPGEVCYNFNNQMNQMKYSNNQITLLRWLTFLLKSLALIFMVLLFWIYFYPLTVVFVLQWLSFHWKILIMLLF